MIEYDIPGFKKINAGFLVLDYNGTVAVDGMLIPGVKDALNRIAESLEVHVVTADTFGRAVTQLEGVSCSLAVLEPGNQDVQKSRYIANLDVGRVIAIGNGRNDNLMVKEAALGIAVIQAEGAAAATVINSDIVCTSIMDALDMVLSPLRVIATLRQ